MQTYNIFKSKAFQITTWVLALLIIIFISFSAGVRIGFDKAAHNFERRGMAPRYMPHGSGTPSIFMEKGEFSDTFGLQGVISEVKTNELVVKDKNGEERIVTIASSTKIRSGRSDINIGDVKIGDMIIVFGETNNQENIVPKLIRIMPKFDGKR